MDFFPCENPTWRFQWVVLSRLISRVTILVTHIRGLKTPLISTHEPPSRVFRQRNRKNLQQETPVWSLYNLSQLYESLLLLILSDKMVRNVEGWSYPGNESLRMLPMSHSLCVATDCSNNGQTDDEDCVYPQVHPYSIHFASIPGNTASNENHGAMLSSSSLLSPGHHVHKITNTIRRFEDLHSVPFSRLGGFGDEEASRATGCRMPARGHAACRRFLLLNGLGWPRRQWLQYNHNGNSRIPEIHDWHW